MKGSGTVANNDNMLAGLKNRSPATQDSSRKLGKQSVNSEATRSETAPAESTIGPRTA
ncbi:MAG: hypothetical protein KGL35_24865 [Bradyrhizobium sp.]|nr:hypothetical protein [Bradyrhizobium sp.]